MGIRQFLFLSKFGLRQGGVLLDNVSNVLEAMILTNDQITTEAYMQQNLKRSNHTWINSL